MSMQPAGEAMHVPADLVLWQAEAQTLPVGQVTCKAVRSIRKLAVSLDALNEQMSASYGKDSGRSDEDIEKALVAVIMAAVSAGVYTLGVVNRSPGGLWIIGPTVHGRN
jgi:hypothetical protein